MDTRYYLGLSHEAVGENKKAAENLEEAYANNQLKPEIRSALVRLYRKTGEYDKAEKIIRRSLR
ncbi:MAG TPA: tetratricopeptide repeat protein [Spirochaetes bacterium]|nr:tetratricopeptide repeat protein [Spirochaetota bacterium]